MSAQNQSNPRELLRATLRALEQQEHSADEPTAPTPKQPQEQYLVNEDAPIDVLTARVAQARALTLFFETNARSFCEDFSIEQSISLFWALGSLLDDANVAAQRLARGPQA